MTLPSYPKVYNLGHRVIRDLFDGPVVVQEKVDGSQFGFGSRDGEFFARSRGRQIDPDAPDKLFLGAVTTARAAFAKGVLVEGWVYRGEAMMGPRHNTLVYERAPLGNLVLFDIDRGVEDRIYTPHALEEAAEEIGCEATPEFYRGIVSDLDSLKALTKNLSFLGGRMEGIVIKNYERFGERDGKMLMGKYVTEEFKEQHSKNPDWKATTKNDILAQIQERYCHERRWEKAIERLRDAGELQDAPQDIGPLIAAIQADVHEECADEIAQMLYGYYRKQILKGTTLGLPEWYKERLASAQFSEE